MRFASVSVLAVALLSCRERPQDRAVTPPKPVPAQANADLSSLAKRLDPGEAKSLSSDMPTWVSDALGVQAGTELGAAVLDLRGQWTAWKERVDADAQGRVFLWFELVRRAALVERALATAKPSDRIEAWFALAPVYAACDAPAGTLDRDAFALAVDLLLERLRGSDPAAAREQARDLRSEQLWTYVIATMRRADAAHRRALTELVRHAPNDPRLADVLAGGATTIGARDSELAIALARAAVDRQTDAEPDAEHWLALAHACFAGLEPECGSAAVAHAWKIGGADDPALARRIEAAVADGTRVQRVLELRAEHALAPRLELARLSSELGRHADANELYTGLAKEFPADARPAVGLAELHLAQTFDYDAATAVLDAVPRPPEHAERRFWELAVGTRAMSRSHRAVRRIAEIGLAATVVELGPEIDALERDIRALEATGSDAGVVLAYVVARGREALPHVAAGASDRVVAVGRRVLPDALAIARRHPTSLNAQRLVLAGTSFSSDRTATFSALQRMPEFLRPVQNVGGVAPPRQSSDLAALRLQWLRAWLDASIVWGDPLQAEMLASRVIEGEVTLDVQILLTDLEAFVARMRDQKENWPGIASAYQDQSNAVAGERQARLLHNAGVAFIAAGQLAEGEPLLRRAMEIDPKAADLAKLNLFAAGVDGIDLSPLVSAQRLDIRVLALGLAKAAARGAERKRLAAAFRAARTSQCRESVYAQALPGPAGVVLRGTLSADLAIAPGEGLQLRLVTTSEPWLLVSSAYAATLAHPCPTDRARGRRPATRSGRDSHP